MTGRHPAYGQVIGAATRLAELGHDEPEIYRRLGPTFPRVSIRGAIAKLRHRGAMPARDYAVDVVLIRLSRNTKAQETIKRLAKDQGVLPGQVARLAMLRGLAAMAMEPASPSWWTEARKADLKTRYLAGDSAGTIAAGMGTTRNAVIGMVNRLGLRRDKPPVRAPGKPLASIVRRQGAHAKAQAQPRPIHRANKGLRDTGGWRTKSERAALLAENSPLLTSTDSTGGSP